LKHTKHICFINLILFLGSFLLLSVSGFASKGSENQVDLLTKHSVSKQGTTSATSIQQLSEETENENENDLKPAFNTLLFSLTLCSLNTQSYVFAGVSPKFPKVSQPIYISVSNFRI
jgi:hypothetical protein